MKTGQTWRSCWPSRSAWRGLLLLALTCWACTGARAKSPPSGSSPQVTVTVLSNGVTTTRRATVDDLLRRYHLAPPLTPPVVYHAPPGSVHGVMPVGSRVDPDTYRRMFGREEPSLAEAAAMREHDRHQPVYSLPSEAAAQKWAVMRHTVDGFPVCCGEGPPRPLSHGDIAVLQAAGAFRAIPLPRPLPVWQYILLGLVAVAPGPWLYGGLRRRYLARRQAEHAARVARARAVGERMAALRAGALPPAGASDASRPGRAV